MIFLTCHNFLNLNTGEVNSDISALVMFLPVRLLSEGRLIRVFSEI